MPHGGTRETITVQFDNEIWDTLEEREVLCPAAPAARACGMDDGRKGAAVVVVLRGGSLPVRLLWFQELHLVTRWGSVWSDTPWLRGSGGGSFQLRSCIAGRARGHTPPGDQLS